MYHSLNDDLFEIENKMYIQFTSDTECLCEKITGKIKTTIDECPSNVEFLQIKRNLMSRLEKVLDKDNYYVDNIEFSFHKFSRYEELCRRHEWDLVGVSFTFGLILPFLIPKMMYSLYKYSTTEDFNYIEYTIFLRKKMVENSST